MLAAANFILFLVYCIASVGLGAFAFYIQEASLAVSICMGVCWALPAACSISPSRRVWQNSRDLKDTELTVNSNL